MLKCARSQNAGRREGCVYGRTDRIGLEGDDCLSCKARDRGGKLTRKVMDWFKGIRVSRLVKRTVERD